MKFLANVYVSHVICAETDSVRLNLVAILLIDRNSERTDTKIVINDRETVLKEATIQFVGLMQSTCMKNLVE